MTEVVSDIRWDAAAGSKVTLTVEGPDEQTIEGRQAVAVVDDGDGLVTLSVLATDYEGIVSFYRALGRALGETLCRVLDSRTERRLLATRTVYAFTGEVEAALMLDRIERPE